MTQRTYSDQIQVRPALRYVTGTLVWGQVVVAVSGPLWDLVDALMIACAEELEEMDATRH